jgi:hypothetical protein
MKYIFIILFFLLSINLYAQGGLKTKKFDYDIKRLESIGDDCWVHIVFRSDSQSVVMFSKNGKDFSGYLFNFIGEYKKVKTEFWTHLEPRRIVYEKIELNNAQCSKMGSQLLREKFYDIPSDTAIEDWDFAWLHCVDFYFKFKIDTTVSEMKYRCAIMQHDSVAYAKQIKETYDSLVSVLGLISKYSDFKIRQKKGRTYGSGYSTVYFKTNRELKKWESEKPKREYLYSIKDSLSEIVEDRLNKIFKNPKEAESLDFYRLTFSKTGKLKKVVPTFPPKNDEYKKVVKLIKAKVKKINLSPIDPKYEFTRIIYYNDDKRVVRVSDDTNYH